jgi:hypothetical protein
MMAARCQRGECREEPNEFLGSGIMVDHYSFAASPRLRLLVLLALVIVPGCRSSSPVAPDGARPTISGHVYQTLTREAGEPPLVDVVITVLNATGQETTALSNRAGFYSVGAAIGIVLVTAAKEGYETRQSRFDVSESTVLNFGLTPNVELAGKEKAGPILYTGR